MKNYKSRYWHLISKSLLEHFRFFFSLHDKSSKLKFRSMWEKFHPMLNMSNWSNAVNWFLYAPAGIKFSTTAGQKQQTHRPFRSFKVLHRATFSWRKNLRLCQPHTQTNTRTVWKVLSRESTHQTSHLLPPAWGGSTWASPVLLS